MSEHNELENQNFVLGEINAVVKSLPSRMDRFEAQTAAAFADLRRDFQANMTGFNSRLAKIELEHAQLAGIRGTFTWIIGILAATCSGLLTAWFFKK